MRTLSLGVLAVLATLGCGEHEGDVPGECLDGADNDRDGFFDCDDQDCVFSPDCDDDPTNDTTDTGTDTDDDTDEEGVGDPRLLELTGGHVTYTVSIVFSLPIFGVDDCSLVFEGDGNTVEDVAGMRVTFDGTYARTGGNCPAELNDAFWTPGDGKAHHSFVFGQGMETLDDWYAHSSPSDHSEEEAEWYATEMDAAYDHAVGTTRWETSVERADIQATITEVVEVRFDK